MTGPTAAATIDPSWNRDTTSRPTPCSSAALSHASAPGAEVNTTASISPTAAASTDARSASGSGGGPQR
ncbi:Uncharacterised protein [Mycobacteroides abscessus]|nr:Uncharacterised protein [Mycobacteroides abscessus]